MCIPLKINIYIYTFKLTIYIYIYINRSITKWANNMVSQTRYATVWVCSHRSSSLGSEMLHKQWNMHACSYCALPVISTVNPIYGIHYN